MPVILSTRQVRLILITLAICALMLTGTISYGILHKINQGDQVVRTAAAEADQIERLGAQLDAQGRDAAAAQAALKNQLRATRAELRRTQRQNRLIFIYLHKLGVTVPPALLAPERSGSAPLPKAPAARPPHRKRRANPVPTGNTASADLLGWLCQLLHLSTCPHL